MEYLDNSLSFFFPSTDKIPEPRDTQIDLINQSVELFNQGHKHIVVCAPTGSGKSAYGLWMARLLANFTRKETVVNGKSTFSTPKIVYTSPLNVLVDQMNSNFEIRYIKTIKGREHYACVSGKENCAVGWCKLHKCSMVHELPRECKSCEKSHPELFDRCPCNHCIYKKELALFKNHNIGNTNFTLFQYGIAEGRDIIVIDECDAIESFIRMQHSFTVDEIIKGDYTEHIARLKEIKMDVDVELELVLEGRLELSAKQIHKLKNKSNNIKTLIEDYEKGRAWCVSYNYDRTKYEPINTDRFLEPLIKDKIVIFMSATPEKREDAGFIEVGSTFPIENRLWEYKPLGQMGIKYRNETVHNIAEFLTTLEGKTLVHCHSYGIARMLSSALKPLTNNKVFTQVNNVIEEADDDNYYRKDIVYQFKQSKDDNAILLSVNLARGVDFPEYNIKNNVIAKFPWFDHTDPLTIAKNRQEGNVKWQWKEISRTLMQAYGRLPRSPEKISHCYIVDSDFNNPRGISMAKLWYDRHKEYFFDWFKDAEVRM